MTPFSERLRARAEAMGMTQADLARRMDLDPRRVGHYMTGLREPDFQTLTRLVRVLDTSSDSLLGLSVAEQPPTESSVLRSKIVAVCNSLDADTLDIVLVLATAMMDHKLPPVRRSPAGHVERKQVKRFRKPR